MSKNVKLNGNDYLGVSTIQIPTTDGETSSFKDVDEIAVPTGSKNITENGTYDVSAFASAVVNVPTGGSGGDTAMEDGLVTRTLTEYTNDRVTTIGSGAFDGYETIKSVSFPNVTSFVGSYNFLDCKVLESVDFPKLVASGHQAFANCTSLANVNMPKLEVAAHAFKGCTSLKKIVLPSLKGELGIYNCTALECADLGGEVTETNAQTPDFENDSKFTTLILRYPYVVRLDNVNKFKGTPFASDGTGGTVYCPQALIEQYQTATNWSTLYAGGTCHFVAIEGSEYE